MKPAMFATPIALMMLQHLVQQARCFTRATHPFNRRASWQLLTTTRPLPVTSSPPRHTAQTPCRPQTHLFSSNTGESSVVPITVLSGFLGSGKTTVLQHILTNNEGLKIAVIVNDVASVNIDSKLVRGRTASSGGDGAQGSDNNDDSAAALPAGIVELQNGCACCSTSGELLSSVSELMILSDMRQEDERFDHIVIEMSGVGEPRSVRNIFQEAMMYDMPLMERVSLDTLVTVVDCSTYNDYLRSKRLANVLESPELFYKNEEDRKRAEEEEDDSWMEGMPSNLVDVLTGDSDERGYEGGVCDLLVEQTEVADVLLLNKIDIIQGELEDTKQLVTALNPRAKIIATSFGKVTQLKEILAVSQGEGVAMDGVVDDHKDYVIAAEAQNCADPDCADPLHAHDHSHSHNDHSADGQSDDAAGCADSDCTDTSHSHSHHDHSADEQSDDAADCADPACTDTSHDHSHSHSSATATHAGIGAYVYRARRPFHPSRLLSILQKLPVVRGVPTEQSDDMAEAAAAGKAAARGAAAGAAAAAGAGSPGRAAGAAAGAAAGEAAAAVANDTDESLKKVFQKILRSKGFAWTADSNVKALYWSHAGSSFEMQCLGRWWATLPKQQWPEEAKDSILADFDSLDHDDIVASPHTSTVGDRRQEVVFIGPDIGSLDSQTVIKSALDSCLLNDEEWDIYRSKRDDEASLTYFENPLQERMLTY